MRVIVYRNYRFIDKDPIIDAIKTVVKTDEQLKDNQAAAITGVSPTTFAGWFEGGTRRPQNATVSQVAAGLGYVRRDSLNADGTVTVGFVKARKLDYKEEREKQADWLLKQGRKTKKRKRNSK